MFFRTATTKPLNSWYFYSTGVIITKPKHRTILRTNPSNVSYVSIMFDPSPMCNLLLMEESSAPANMYDTL